MKINVPYNYQSKYYYNKFPLYMKQPTLNKLFSYFETFYIELEKFNVSYKYILQEMLSSKEHTQKLSLGVIQGTGFQNKLLDKYNELVKRNSPLKYQLFYYQFLVHIYSISPLTLKNDWINFLNLFGLRYYIKISQDDHSLKLKLDENLDELLKWIFMDLISRKIFKEVVVEKVFNEDLFNRERLKNSYFDFAYFDKSYFFNETPNELKITYEEKNG